MGSRAPVHLGTDVRPAPRPATVVQGLMAIATTNPATGEIEKTFEALSDAEVDERIARAAATAVEYRRTSFDDRAACMNAAADSLEASSDDTARAMTTDVHNTIITARV